MTVEKEREKEHCCKFCGKRDPGLAQSHDSFWNDLVIHEKDSPALVKEKMDRQDRLKFHDIFAVYKKYPVPKEWTL